MCLNYKHNYEDCRHKYVIINKILHMGYTYMTTGMYNGEGKN